MEHVCNCELCATPLEGRDVECVAPCEGYVRPFNRWERVPECVVLCRACLEECYDYWRIEREAE